MGSVGGCGEAGGQFQVVRFGQYGEQGALQRLGHARHSRCLEALDAVREVWPERLPLTMRLGGDDFHAGGITFEESITAIG